ncbi:MAG: ABC transporter substrate-binding protein [Thermodesulfobacteriota bacterium]|nr:ABC transporter substrate-binding protein [Thermodesulfobacteriota bacterium]
MKIKNTFLLTGMIFGSLLFINNLNSQAKEVRGVTDDTITVGTVMDLTGPVADNLTPYAVAVRNYFKHINDQGGINNRKVKVIVEDDRYSIPMAVAAFKKLVFRDKVLSIIGMGSPQTTALLNQIEKNKLPTITYSPLITMTNPFRRYVFNHSVDYGFQTMMLIDYVKKDLKVKDARFAIATGDRVWGKRAIESSKERLKEYGLKLLDIELLPMTVMDASTEAMNLRRAKANYVLMLHGAPASIALYNSSKKIGYAPTFLAGDASCPDVVVPRARDAAKNVIGTWSFNSWFDKTPGINRMKELTLKYQPKAGKPNRHYSWGWVAAMISAEGMKRAGRDLNGETLVSTLESIQNFDTGDISGPINYSSKSHRGAEYIRFLKANIEKGRFVPITGWRKLEE